MSEENTEERELIIKALIVKGGIGSLSVDGQVSKQEIIDIFEGLFKESEMFKNCALLALGEISEDPVLKAVIINQLTQTI